MKLKNCEFEFKQKVNFLGHVGSGNGVEIQQTKVEEISKYPEPTSKRELQQWQIYRK